MSDLVKGYTDFAGEEPNGHPYEVYHADDVQEVLQGKDARIAVAYYAATADAVNVVLNDAAARAAYDDALAAFAERVVHALIDMGAHGCAFLHLTEVA